MLHNSYFYVILTNMSFEETPFGQFMKAARPSPEELALIHYEVRIGQARALSDHSKADGSTGIDINTAYEAIDQFAEARLMRIIPLPEGSPMAEVEALVTDRPAISELDSAQFFRLAEALDTIMTFGENMQKLDAAVLANELLGSMPYTNQPEVKVGILKNLLGIDPFIGPASRQLAERYVYPTGTPEEHQAVAEAIEFRSRVH